MPDGPSAELRLTPTAMVAGGAALARDDTGRVVFVEGALPDEVVTVRLLETHADFARGIAVEILEPSPDRITPPCPALAAGCGGCTWQHIDPEAQVRLKIGIVVDALHRIGHLRGPPEPTVVTLDGPARRTTARLAVSPDGRAGYRPRRGPGVAIETDSCLAAHPLLEELITQGRYPGAESVLLRVGVASGERLVRTWPAGVASRVRVPAGVVVVGDGVRAAWVHETVAGREFRVSADSFFQPGPVAASALVAGVVDAIVGSSGAGPSFDGVAVAGVVVPDGGGSVGVPDGGGSVGVPDGSGSVVVPDGGGSVVVPDGSGSVGVPGGAVVEGSGSPAESGAAEGARVGGRGADRGGAGGLTVGGHVVDAYAGVGLFASVLGARYGCRVTAIESDRSAVADARLNLADVDAHVVARDVGRWHPRRGDLPVDAVAADPPRAGLGRPGVAAVVATQTPRLVLVSCDPASLGRDVALLRQAGYHLVSVALVDAFPHTFHVETVSRFDRTNHDR